VSFYSEKPIKAVRKARACHGCGRRIEVGEPAIGCAGHYDGEFWSGAYHGDCRKAEIELNDLHEVRHGDEWMNLGDDMEWEDWPWLVAEFPGVASRMKITIERFNEVRDERERVRKAWSEIDAKNRAAWATA
jgi:hypothetical protein